MYDNLGNIELVDKEFMVVYRYRLYNKVYISFI